MSDNSIKTVLELQSLSAKARAKADSEKSTSEILEDKFSSTEDKTSSDVVNSLLELSGNHTQELSSIEDDFWGDSEDSSLDEDQEIKISIAIKGGKVSVSD